MMRKRILALVAALAMMVALSACGGAVQQLPALELETSSGESSGDVKIVRPNPDSADFEDTLMGLMTYMESGKAAVRDTEAVTFDNGSAVIAEGTSSFVQMSFKEIGADNGYRYQFTLNNSTVQVEFYSFDLENLNDKARECISSVKEKGYFPILDKEVKAVLHPSEKYLMVYTDSRAEGDRALDVNVDQKEWAEQLFLKFHAE